MKIMIWMRDALMKCVLAFSSNPLHIELCEEGMNGALLSWLKHAVHTRKTAGSNPATPTILRCGFSARARTSCVCGVRVKLNSTGETETSK